MVWVTQQVWPVTAIHDSVAVLVRDRIYQRSILGSLIGRALMAIVQGISRLIDAAKHLPGGKTTVIVAVGIIVALIAAKALLTAQWQGDELIGRRSRAGRHGRWDPWAEAERLAAAGDYTGAAHALYQAVLRRLAGSERIRLHASKTSGDYARELRRGGSSVAAPFQQFGRRFDHVIFGVGECSQDEFEAMLRDASAITSSQAT